MKKFLLFEFVLVCSLLAEKDLKTNVETKEVSLQEETVIKDAQECPEEKQLHKAFYNRNGLVIGIFGGMSLMDMESGYYVNIFEIGGVENSKLNIAPSYGLKLGYDVYFLPQHGMRVYIDYMASNFLNHSSIVGKSNLHTFIFNTDYKYEIIDHFGVFGGLSLNYSMLDSSKLGKQEGLGVGLNAGFAYAIASWSEFEVGLRYLGKPFAKKTVSPPDALGQVLGAERQIFDFGDLFNLRIGFNFKI